MLIEQVEVEYALMMRNTVAKKTMFIKSIIRFPAPQPLARKSFVKMRHPQLSGVRLGGQPGPKSEHEFRNNSARDHGLLSLANL